MALALQVTDVPITCGDATLGVSVPQLALAWNWQQPGVTSAIAGSRDIEHTRSNAAAGDLELDDRALVELEALIQLGETEGS